MATEASFAEYICDQLSDVGGVTARKMFGEYGIFRHGKIVALACDNQLFVKPTPEGEAVLVTPIWGPPYPGAKPFFNVSDLLDDTDTLVRLIEVTDAALPAPKKKAAKTKAAPKKAATKKAPPKKAAPKKAATKKAAPKKAVAKKVAVKKTVKKAVKKGPARKVAARRRGKH
jgi:TfoX/Sxy family transcriptional regulator of competence genes